MTRSQDARFNKGTAFWDSQFEWAVFSDARFSFAAGFTGARFSEAVLFNGVQFVGVAWFANALFNDDAHFDNAQFNGPLWFSRAQFRLNAVFKAAHFKQAGQLGPICSQWIITLNSATFEQTIVIEAATPALFCVGTRFAETAALRVRYAYLVLDNAVFAQPSTVTFVPDPFKHSHWGADVESFDEGPLARADRGRSPRPRLMSLRDVDVATLTLSELDLSPCLFQGTHHLDQRGCPRVRGI
jgi:uncharacterized protein YjbI with pentapeptide repeats